MLKLTGKRFLLLLLYAKSGDQGLNAPIAGRTRLVKMGFLFREELMAEFCKDMPANEVKFPSYFAWKYGPFSKDLMNDLEFLINQNHIEVMMGADAPLPEELEEYEFWNEDDREPSPVEYTQEIFRLTEEYGVPRAEQLWNELTENQQKLLNEFKTVLNRASLGRILEYVYKKYKGEYTDKSLIRDRYLS